MKQAIVTGAGGGLGFSICKSLSENNFSVAAVDLNLTDSEKTSDKLNNTKPYAADVRDEESINSLYEKIDNTPDLIVNNAGIARFGKLFDQKLSDFQDVVQTNLIGSFIVATEGAKRMVKEDKKGSIINITSVVGHTGNLGQSNYSASKAGIIGMSKSLAIEYAKKNITVNCVSPGFIVSDMTMNIAEKVKLYLTSRIPMGKLGTGEDVSNCVAFLSSESASYVTGETIHVNGGMYMS